ncbi:hypothetical protein DFJ73DRAFT_629103 [Zopfochytrium polystomum]|nr:hypothetical protein DFJ73DRAFT_629103 [Zopfochytrium polystomum]
MNFFFASFVVVEPLRIWLGFSGNLSEKVPDLAGSFLFTCFPQLFACFYFTSVQPKLGQGFNTPFEVALNIVGIALLLPQLYFGYEAGRAIVKSQAASFFLTLSEEPPDEEGSSQDLVENEKGNLKDSLKTSIST